MANIDDVYPKRFLQSDQLDGDWELTIKECWVEELKGFDGKAQQKLILSFAEIEQEFPLTPTNAGRIKGLLGSETDEYPGQKILIGLEDQKVGAENKRVIRIKQPIKVTKPPGKPVKGSQPTRVTPRATSETEAADQAADSQAPF